MSRREITPWSWLVFFFAAVIKSSGVLLGGARAGSQPDFLGNDARIMGFPPGQLQWLVGKWLRRLDEAYSRHS